MNGSGHQHDNRSVAADGSSADSAVQIDPVCAVCGMAASDGAENTLEYRGATYHLWPELLPNAFNMNGVAPLYFEAAAVITTLVLLGQVLEL